MGSYPKFHNQKGIYFVSFVTTKALVEIEKL
jgi:hypothetical protein